MSSDLFPCCMKRRRFLELWKKTSTGRTGRNAKPFPRFRCWRGICRRIETALLNEIFGLDFTRPTLKPPNQIRAVRSAAHALTANRKAAVDDFRVGTI